jgi:hypothetical protein
MPDRKNLCVLVATLSGLDALAGRLGVDEARHAAERALNRIERAAESHGGIVLEREPAAFVLSFERCDAAALAACEMLDRVLSLPPMSGSRLSVQVGIHYGSVDADPAAGDGVDFARRLAALAHAEQALASGAAVMLLGPSSRHLAGSQPLRSDAVAALDWPVYALGQRVGAVTSIPAMLRLSQRLRLRHQQDVLFAEEQRPVILLGRELGNDVVIMDPRASRQHARIERRRDGFVLVDTSTNGTYVSTEPGQEACVRSSEMKLVGPGRIGFGYSANDIARDLVFFELV